MSVHSQSFDLVYSTNKRDILDEDQFCGDPKDYWAAVICTLYDQNGKVVSRDQVILEDSWIDADQKDWETRYNKAVEARRLARK